MFDPLIASYIVNALLLLFAFGSPLLCIVALLQLRRRRTQGTELALWAIIILFVPILGAVAYFITAHRQQPRDIAAT